MTGLAQACEAQENGLIKTEVLQSYRSSTIYSRGADFLYVFACMALWHRMFGDEAFRELLCAPISAGQTPDWSRAPSYRHAEPTRTPGAREEPFPMFVNEKRDPRTRRTLSQHSQQELELLVRQRTAELHGLSARLLRVQEEERRRLSRELHDSTGQTLTALKIQVATLESNLNNQAAASAAISQINGLADQALQEIRTASYLLYPPLLDESGFISAAQWYVEGFAKRSSVEVRLHLAPTGRLPRAVETVLFRVLQEALTNVYRHSASRIVDIRLWLDAGLINFEVRDYGKGIAPELLEQFSRTGGGVGVGLAGMRERVEDLCGRLEVSSDGTGTLIRATLPPGDVGSISSEAGAFQRASA
jgi:signal transduction histidine kinase